MKSSKGFTLIEVMITVIIVAVLASIAVPSYNRQVTKTRRTDCQGVLINFSLNMERFFAANNTYIGAADGGATGAPLATVFPSECPLDAGTKYYDLTITAATASNYTLTATPKGIQVDDGFLQLSSAGVKSWDQDNSGGIDAGENSWDAH